MQCWCRFHACCLRHGANATTACGAGAALVAPVLAAPAVCAPGQLLRCAAPPPAAPVPLGAAMRMGCDGAQRTLVLPLHPQGSPAAGEASLDAFMVARDGTPLPRAALGADIEPM